MVRRQLVALMLCLVLVLCSGCAPWKRINIHDMACFPMYTLASATEDASEIVYGQVTAKGPPVQVLRSSVCKEKDGARMELVRGECYRLVAVEVLDCAKGRLSPGDTVTYREYGGETALHTWTYSSTTEVSPGDRVLFFRHDDGDTFTELFWIVEDPACLRIPRDMLPAEYDDAVECSVEAFLDGIRAE